MAAGPVDIAPQVRLVLKECHGRHGQLEVREPPAWAGDLEKSKRGCPFSESPSVLVELSIMDAGHGFILEFVVMV